MKLNVYSQVLLDKQLNLITRFYIKTSTFLNKFVNKVLYKNFNISNKSKINLFNT